MTELPSWGFEPGVEIGPGRSVLRALGGGFRFEVVLVWDERWMAIMVAKVLRPHLLDDAHARAELAQEAEALATLAHPVIVRGFDAVLEGPHPHLLLEHLEGPSLRSLLRRGGRLDLQQLLPLTLHLAAAAHYLAASGWVHLDIKPDNVIMGVPPRLIDLSLATTVERAARFTSPVGTDAYMPPEQCVPGLAPVGPPADVWGLGATVWHAVSGHRPFPRPEGARDSDLAEVRFPQLREAPAPLPRETPPELEATLRACLERDPGARPDAAGLARSLEPLVAALPRKMRVGDRRR